MSAHTLPLSIIIVSTDHEPFLPGLFACLRAQCMDAEEMEIIFVDNGSADSSQRLARVWGDGMECKVFRVLRLEQRMAKGAARAAGLALSGGEFLLCLEGDCLLTQGYVRECMAGLHRTGKDIVFTGFIPLRDGGEAGPIRQPDSALPAAADGQVMFMRRAVWEKNTGCGKGMGDDHPEPWAQSAAGGCTVLKLDKPLYYSRSSGHSRRTTPGSTPGAGCRLESNAPRGGQPESFGDSV
jgi:glycosyltransferase involved in cell wall biosynthesis